MQTAPVQFNGYLSDKWDARQGRNLMQAIEEGNDAKAAKLLRNGVPADTVLIRRDGIVFPGMNQKEYDNPFRKALWRGNISLARQMVAEFGVDVTEPFTVYGPPGWSQTFTYLGEALWNYPPEALEFLLDKGADPDMPIRLPLFAYFQPIITGKQELSPVEAIVFDRNESDSSVRKLEILLDRGAKADIPRLVETLRNHHFFNLSDTFAKPRTLALLESRLQAQAQPSQD